MKTMLFVFLSEYFDTFQFGVTSRFRNREKSPNFSPIEARKRLIVRSALIEKLLERDAAVFERSNNVTVTGTAVFTHIKEGLTCGT